MLDHILTQAGIGARNTRLFAIKAGFNAANQNIVCVAANVRMGADHLLSMHGFFLQVSRLATCDCTVAQLAKSKAAIEARAESLYNTGLTQAQMQFAPSAERGALDSEIRAYIREQAGKGEGLMKIRQAMEDKAVAAVVFHSPSFLLDIAPENHTKLRFEATERHVPAAYKMMTDSVALRELPAKYDKAINSVRTSFYNPALAAKAKLRVEV